jgi:hypothetical protein
MIILWLASGVVVLLLFEAMLAIVSYSAWTTLKTWATMWLIIIEAPVIDVGQGEQGFKP